MTMDTVIRVVPLTDWGRLSDGLLSQDRLPGFFSSNTCYVPDNSPCSGIRRAHIGSVECYRSKEHGCKTRPERAAEEGGSVICAKLYIVPYAFESKKEARNPRADT